MNLPARLGRIDWLWLIIGGFYLVAYPFWYLPALLGLSRSVRKPPNGLSWHSR